MSRRLCRAAWALAALAAGLGACRCGQSPTPPGPDAGPDARADARPVPDAHMDARPVDAQPDGAGCGDATLIELPPTGISYISIVSNQGRWVAYDYDENGGGWSRPDIYLYDLETCTERRLTNQPTLTQWQPAVWNGQVTYGDYLNESDGSCSITRYHIATGVYTSLFHATGVSIVAATDRFVAYAAKPDGHPEGLQDLYLLDVATGESSLLETAEDGAGSGGDMSETHFTWPSGIVNEYCGIWVVELSTGYKWKIDNSNRGGVPSTWGDWVVWEDYRSGGPDIWGARLGSGEQVHVTDNGAFNGFPRLRGHLLCFRTTLWGQGLGWDIALMDMDTWVVRRITTTTHPGYSCGHADGGWLVYRKQVRQDYVGYDKIYAVNLVAAGFLDSQGHLIPR